MSHSDNRQNEQMVVSSEWRTRGLARRSPAELQPPSEVRAYETGRAWTAAFRVQNAEAIAELALDSVVEYDRHADAVTLARPQLTQVALAFEADLIDGCRAVIRQHLAGS
jgi:hypothetical protein